MPEEKPSTVSSTEGLTGDGGVAWWKKAYQRCVEAAKEEGRSLKDVAADRYGVSICLFYGVRLTLNEIGSMECR